MGAKKGANKMNMQRIETNIDNFRKLNKNISLSGLVDIVKDNSVTYKTKKGFAIAYNLLHRNSVGVIKALLKKDTEYVMHSHDVKEWGVVFSGSVSVEHVNKKGKSTVKTYSIGDLFFCDIGESHNQTALEDTKIIFVSVPCDEGYPKNGSQKQQ